MFSISGESDVSVKVIGFPTNVPRSEGSNRPQFHRFYLRSCSCADKLCEFGHLLASVEQACLYLFFEENLCPTCSTLFPSRGYFYKPQGCQMGLAVGQLRRLCEP